ncbi:MAG: FAD-dependent oxidoreductase [Kiritimatiellae bacterium]|nr:FAD-dependent oxidoreductase [Kiritimatiellia bacterium]
MFREPARDLPLGGRYDVVVVGGGVAGVSAAIAAARSGASVCLMEKTVTLGGLATLGNVLVFLPLCDGRGTQLVGGLGEELLLRVTADVRAENKRLAVYPPPAWPPESDAPAARGRRYPSSFNVGSCILALEAMVQDAGVHLLYDTRFCAVIKDGDALRAAVVENKDGRLAVAGTVFVDATGDADVCVQAGDLPVQDLQRALAEKDVILDSQEGGSTVKIRPTAVRTTCALTLALFLSAAPAISAEKPTGRFTARGPLKATHGELFFTRAQIQRAKTAPACASLRKTFFRVAEETLNRKPIMGYLDYDSRVKTLTVAYLMTGEKKYFAKVMEYLSAVGKNRWTGGDLTYSHYLIGTAFAYDMLYHEIEPALRGKIRDLLLHRLDLHFNTKTYYYYFDTARTRRSLLLNNHLWWCNNSIYQAAVALRDEIPPELSDTYINTATTLLVDKVIPLLAEDGSGQEGTGYSMYGLYALLTFMETKRINEGVDLYGTNPYFRRIMYSINDLLFPGAPASYVNTGDSDIGGMSRPPPSFCFRLADEFKDPVLQHFGYTFHEKFADRYGYFPSSQLLWFNPALRPQAPTRTPKAVFYEGSGDVIYRTDWSDSALYLNFICSAQKVGHNHPDQNHFILAQKGNHLLVDQGYSYWKNTQEHNTLTIDGYGQLGENYKFIQATLTGQDGVRDFFADDAAGYVHFTGDASTSYRPQCELKMYKRHVAALGNTIAVFDRVKTATPKSMAIRFHNSTIYPIRYATYDAFDEVNRFTIPAPNERALLTVKDSQLSFFLDRDKQTEIKPTVIMHFAGHRGTTATELSEYVNGYFNTRKPYEKMRVCEVFKDFAADGKPPTPHGFHLVQRTAAPTTHAVFSNLLVVKDTGAADPQVTRINASSLSGFKVVAPDKTAVFLFNTSDDLEQRLTYDGFSFKGRMVTLVKDTTTGAVRHRYAKNAVLGLP